MSAQTRQVEEGIGTALALLLAVPGFGDDERRAGCVIANLLRGVERGGFAGDGQVQVDTVKQRSGELVAVALDLTR
ncbi:hypothetical protein BK659_16575 [Pseudomonas brassicacearum]|uniref:Uncharacterized protein n=1 Tax=Pseudomonas brassicacearum TaxID=930166 RepID=A0A423H4P2_9PSED|nr:hypothetical protein BK659_16575 [Pseudomonas brassicacearum]